MTAQHGAAYCRDHLHFSVMAVGANKRPFSAWKHLQAELPSPEQVAGITGNYAIITGAISGVVVVDVDSKEALEWAAKHLPPPAFTTITAKGEHWYYRHPGGEPISNKARITVEGGKLALDIRGDGGYVVGPGSIHETGAIYTAQGDWNRPALDAGPVFDRAWIQKPEPTPKKAPQPLPKPKLEPVSIESSNRVLRARTYLEGMGYAVEGQGGDAKTYRAACVCLELGLTDSEAMALLEEWNRGCAPPWQPHELYKKLENAKLHGKPGLYDKGPDKERLPHPALTPTNHIVDANKMVPPPPPPAGEEPEFEWPEPEPLQAHRPRFPVELLPPVFRHMVEEVSRSTQTPPAMAAMIGLSTLSLVSLKKFHLRITRTWVEDMPLFTVCTAVPGSRKSPVFKQVAEPILTWQAKERRRASRAKTKNEELIKYCLDVLNSNRKKMLSGDFLNTDKLRKDNEAAQLELEGLRRECEMKQLICDDATPESIVQAMAANNGVIGNFSTEGDLFSIMAGKYSKSKTFNIILKAYSGDAHYTNRVHREADSVDHPLMTLGLMTQPDVLDKIRADSDMRRQGLLGRFLYADPYTNVGDRSGMPDDISEDAAEAWSELIKRLLKLPANDIPLRMSAEAKALFVSYKDFVEKRLQKRSGDLVEMADWATKIVGTMGRIATLFHVAENGLGGNIIEQTMVDCIALVEGFLMPHARAMLGVEDASLDVDSFEKILSKIPAEGISLRDLKRKVRSKKIDLENLLDELEMRGHIALFQSGKGGQASVAVHRNPRSEDFIRGPKEGSEVKIWRTLGLLVDDRGFQIVEHAEKCANGPQALENTGFALARVDVPMRANARLRSSIGTLDFLEKSQSNGVVKPCRPIGTLFRNSLKDILEDNSLSLSLYTETLAKILKSVPMDAEPITKPFGPGTRQNQSVPMQNQAEEVSSDDFDVF